LSASIALSTGFVEGRRAAAAVTALFVLAACGQLGTSTAPRVATAARQETKPPQCKDQRTARRYAQIKVTLGAKGALVCIPEFRGYGGAMEYPGVDKSVLLTIRTSAKNIYNEPQLGSGESLVYLNLRFSTNTHFASTVKSKGGLTSEKIQSGQIYTAFGIVQVGHLALMLTPCYTTATSGPYGGVFPNLGELFTDKTITGKGYGVIELYSGMQASEEC
ncbi:MAG: hypothetical protein WAK16_00705, partial [Candidatus Cybelea sp.]